MAAGVRLEPRISLFSGCTIIIGVIVGSGIFVSPKGVLLASGSAGLSIVVWLISGIFSMIGALCYAELGTAIPKSGGDYAYILEAHGKLCGFLFLWTVLVIVNPTSIAVIALTYANYSLKPFFPDCDVPSTAVNLLAACIIAFLTFVNCYDVRAATRANDAFSVTKVLALVSIIGCGIVWLGMGHTEYLERPDVFEGTQTSFPALSLAFYSGVFSFSGWSYLNFVTEELKDPYRNLPRAIYISLPTVTFIYVLVNVAYFAVLSVDEILDSNAVAVTFAEKIMGPFAPLMPLFVAASCVGSVNSLLFTCSRMFFSGAREGQLPELLSMISLRNMTPVPSLLLLGGSSIAMLFFGNVYVLINYLAFAESVICLGSVSGLIRIKLKNPDMKTPIKVPMVVPIFFVIASIFLLVLPFFTEPSELFVGLAIILSGVPVYFLFIWRQPPNWLHRPWTRAVASVVLAAPGRQFPSLIMCIVSARLVLLLLFSLINKVANGFKVGAILREKEDAHIAAALQYAAEWLNQRGSYGHLEYIIENIDVLDHYAALRKACSMVEKDGVVAIIGGSNPLLNGQLNRLLWELDVPLLTSVDNFGGDGSHLDFFPRAQLFEAVVDLFRHWKWNRIIIVYEEDARIRRLEPLLESDEYSSIRFLLVKVQEGNYLRAAKEVKELEQCRVATKKDCSEFSRVLLDLNPEHTYNFLLAGLQMGLIDLKHWFLLTNMELSTMDMELFRFNHARFVSPYAVDSNFLVENRNTFNFSQFKEHVAFKWNAKTRHSRNLRMSEAIFTFDAIYTLANVYSDLAASQQMDDAPQTACKKPTRPQRRFQHGRTLIEALQNNNNRGLTGDLRRLNPDPKASNFSMRIHLLGYSGKLDDIGFWEPATDVHVNMSGDSRAQLQRNVQVSDELKPHFRVTTILERPYVMLKKNHFELDGNSKFEGFCIDLLGELSRDLGFTYTIHVVRDGKYGNDMYGNGTWDGMVGEILKGEAEMAVAPLTVNFKRSEVVDFTKPFLSLGISILYKVPDDQQPDLFSFLNPLSWQIWLAILTAIVCVTLGMFFVARVTPYEWNLNFSCCTAHQPHPAASMGPTGPEAPVELSNNFSFFNTL